MGWHISHVNDITLTIHLNLFIKKAFFSYTVLDTTQISAGMKMVVEVGFSYVSIRFTRVIVQFG